MQETIVHTGGAPAGLQVPGYRILRPLGAGGMASVYLAVQESLDREVALKVMSAQLAADREFTERFLKEGRITAKLSHRNLVTVYDIASHEGVYYLAAEYISGGTLRERMNAGLTLPQILDIVAEVAQGLHFAHTKGVVHRDVKPSNILFKGDGTVVLADFGIAKAMDTTSTATMAGASIGTPDYMSPEQARGEPVDGRSDLYALGVMLYEMLIGRPPFDGSDPFAVALAHITQPVPTLPSEFAWLQPIIDRLMAKRADERPESGEAFIAELDKLRQRMPRSQLGLVVRHDTGRQRAVENAATVPVASSRTRIASPARPAWLPWAGGAVGLMLVLGLAWLLLPSSGQVEPGSASALASSPAVPAAGAISVPLAVSDLESLLTQAEAYLDYGLRDENLGARLTFPEDDSALGMFQQALALDPGNERARAGLKRIADSFAERAATACDRNLWSACNTIAEDGLRVDPERQDLRELQGRAERALRGG